MKTLLIISSIIGVIALAVAFPPFAMAAMFILFIYSLPDSLDKHFDD